jgi:hypothetical protein
MKNEIVDEGYLGDYEDTLGDGVRQYHVRKAFSLFNKTNSRKKRLKLARFISHSSYLSHLSITRKDLNEKEREIFFKGILKDFESSWNYLSSDLCIMNEKIMIFKNHFVRFLFEYSTKEVLKYFKDIPNQQWDYMIDNFYKLNDNKKYEYSNIILSYNDYLNLNKDQIDRLENLAVIYQLQK